MLSEAAVLEHNNGEHITDGSGRLSRSPHPYQRSWHEVRQDWETGGEIQNDRKPDVTLRSETLRDPFFDADYRKRRKHLSSSSDSGTEADDERGALLTGLPAPPLRPRKGLREGYGGSSPLLTPTYIDETSKNFPFESTAARGPASQPSSSANHEKSKLREKFLRRRKAELGRRITETSLMSAVCLLVTVRGLGGFAASFADCRAVGNLVPNSQVHLFKALTVHALLLIILFGLCPVRVIHNNRKLGLSTGKPWYYIHVPAAFDPAPLLYPPIIPTLVALCLPRLSLDIISLNLALAIASIPSKIIPFNRGIHWYNSLQWLLSIISYQWSLASDNMTALHPTTSVSETLWPISRENLACLYALHQVLMSVLGDLTTTSLLPAELQLLSVSLINLLFLSTSPQAVILETLLWMGGLTILLFCGPALRCEVSLARIPSWRFRRNNLSQQTSRNPYPIQALDDCMHGRLTSWGVFGSDELSGDMEIPLYRAAPLSRKGLRAPPTRYEGPSVIQRFIRMIKNRPATSVLISARGPRTGSMSSEAVDPVKFTQHAVRLHRSATLPASLQAALQNVNLEELDALGGDRPRSARSSFFRSLTLAQAKTLKWVFALYTYSVIILAIALPIRQYISTFALHGQEPVGWALGYLFGGLEIFQRPIQSLKLVHWIPLLQGDEVYNSQPATISPAIYLSSSTSPANTRLLLSLYFLMVIALGLCIVLRLSGSVEVDTRRKVFHGMMVVMFLPTIFIDPTFVSLALMLVLAIFLLLDVFRASQLPPISRPLTNFLAPYVDGRDHRGPVIVSHIFLLIGCAIPLWLSLAATPRTGAPPWQGWLVQSRDLSMISGVVCVGMGDAAASLIGRRFGRRRWPWAGGKSLEGSLAFAVAVLAGLSFARWWLLANRWEGDSGDEWVTTFCKGAVASCGASLTEAVLTGGNDNVIVPVVLWLLVKGLAI